VSGATSIDEEARMMETDWNERARRNPFHYICCERTDWDPESFFQSGEDDYARLVAPVLSSLGFAPEGKSVLEVGCGVGRVTRSLARRFATVLALDVSEEMLRRGRELHQDFRNIVWVHGNGKTFQDVPSNSMDFVFSYLVLQHLPNKDLVLAYIHEMLRVLKPGGVYCFQFNGSADPSMNWRGRFVWSLIDKLLDSGQGSWERAAGRALAAALGLDGLAGGRTWRVAAVTPHDVLEEVRQSGGIEPHVTGWATPRTWCSGRKGDALARSA